MAIALLLAAACFASSAEAGFPRQQVPGLSSFRLFDVGVTDFDGDGRLDIFTANHQYGGALLRNRGDWRFQNVYASAGLSVASDFPGYEDIETEPAKKTPGLYIYARDHAGYRVKPTNGDTLELRSLGRASRVGLTLYGRRKVRMDGARGASLTVLGGRYYLVKLQAGGRASLTGIQLQLPVSVETDGGPTYVGSRAAQASESRFDLALHDRHAYAFADLGGSPAEDVFIGLGGLGGGISQPGYRLVAEDEVLISAGGRYQRAYLGLDKGACRGRGVAAADLDGNGLTDMVSVCERSFAVADLRQSDGGFVKERIHGTRGATALRVMQTDGDPKPEILAAGEGWARILELRRRTWRIRRSFRLVAGATGIALGDFIPNGHQDALVFDRKGNTLLTGSGRGLRRASLTRYGLPRKSVAFAWVDLDNDGDLDGHSVPDGVFRARRHGFEATGQLALKSAYSLLSWADLDLDGRRDVIYTIGSSPFNDPRTVVARRNEVPAGRWLQLDLPGESEGARVQVRRLPRGGSSTLWAGEQDDARFSQGNGRLAIGLGRARRARIRVEWTDGRRARTTVRAGSVVTLRR